MPFTTINIGVDPDDVTGDTNRIGWSKVNDNFASADSQLAAKATVVDLDALSDSTDAAIAVIEAALALKQDVGDPLDPGDGVAHYDAAQTISITERRQLVINTGGYVTLNFQFVAPTVDVAGVTTYKLPILPENFRVHSAYLSLYQRTVGSGGTFVVAFTVDQGATNIATNAGTAMTGTGKIGSTISGTPTLTNGTVTTATVTVTNTETGAPVAKGLELWLRGVWEA